MCLYSISQKFNPPIQPTIPAWKLFRVRYGKLYPVFYDKQNEVPIGVWFDAMKSEEEDDLISTYYGAAAGDDYKAGFHSFANRKDIADFKREEGITGGVAIRKVLVKDIHTIGIQCGAIVYVSRQLFVPRGAK